MQKKYTVSAIRKLASLLLILLLMSFSISSCNRTNRPLNSPTSENSKEGIVTGEYPDDIKMRPFKNSDSTWGFTIYMNGKIYIHQPVLPGNELASGFKTEKDASRVADLIMKKIVNHTTPESVSDKELDSLGIVKPKKINK
jgi:hypothetical protein